MIIRRIISALIVSQIMLCSGIFFPLNTAYAATGVPKVLNHQGRLLDASGNLLGGSGTDYCVKFSIYDDAAVGGTDAQLWPTASSSPMTVTVKYGVFNVGIGDTLAGGDALDYNFQDNDAVYLNVEVATKSGAVCGTFENLSPRQRIASSAYAINASTTAGFSPSQSPTGSQIPVLTSGNLLLAGTNPQINATSTSALVFQGGTGTGDIQFFSSSNKITSAGNLTIAGVLNTAGLTVTGSSTLGGISYSWPAAGGSNGYILSTNGSGVLSWVPDQTGSGAASYWVLAGSTLYSTSTATSLGIGTDSPSSTLHVVGSFTATGSSTLSGLSAGLVRSSAAGLLTAGRASLTADVSGILPLGNGGTGTSTTPASLKFLVGNGTSFEYLSLAAGTNIGSISKLDGTIVVNGSATPIFTTLTVNGTTTLGASTTITNLSAGLVKSSSAGLLTAGLASLTSEVTGILPVANGGTATSTTPTSLKFLVGNGTAFEYLGLSAGSNMLVSKLDGNFQFSVTSTPSFSGLTADGTTFFVDATNHRVGVGTTTPATAFVVVGTSTFAGDLIPDVANRYSIGTEELPWESLYVSSSTIHIGTAKLSNTGGQLLFNGAVVLSTTTPTFNTLSNVGTTTLMGNTTILGNTNLAGFISIAGAIKASSTVEVTGDSRLQSVSSTNLFVGGQATIANFFTGIVRSNASGTLSSGAVTLNTADVTGTLPFSSGGTGTSTVPAALKFLVGNGTTNEYLSIAAGTNIGSISKLDGTIVVNGSLTPTFTTITVNGTSSLAGLLLPATDNLYENGTTSLRWRSLSIGTGATNASGTLSISGQTSLGSELQVTGTSRLAGLTATTGNFSGAVKSSTTLSATGQVSFGAETSHVGLATFLAGITDTGTFTQNGTSSLRSILPITDDLYANGTSTLRWRSLSVGTGAMTASGTLSATGQASLGAELQVTGAASLLSTASVSGLLTTSAGITSTGTFTSNGTSSLRSILPITDDLYANGTTTLRWRSLTIGTGALNASGTLSVSGQTSLGSELQVTGASRLANVSSTNLLATGNVNAGALQVVGATTLGASTTITNLSAGLVKSSSAGILTAGLVNLTSEITGILPIANGGTATSTTPAANKFLVGNGTTNEYLSIAAGTNIGSISKLDGTIVVNGSLTPTFTTITVNGTSSLAGLLLPATDNAYENGTTSLRWRSLSVGTGTVTASGTLSVSGQASFGSQTSHVGLASFLAGMTVTGTHTQNGTTSIAGLFFPASDNVYDVGTTTLKFRSLTIGTGAINASGTLSISGQTSLGSELQVTGASRLANVSSTNLLATGNVNAGALQVVQGTTLGASTTITNLSAGLVKSSATGVLTAGQASLTSEVSGILPVANGGTGTSTTPASLKFLVGNGTSFEYLGLSAGSNVSIAKLDGNIQITSSASGASDGNDPFKWIASGANLYASSTYTKVGIGNTTPSSTLHITGDLYVTSSSTISGAVTLNASTTITNLSAGVVKSSAAGILTAGLANLTSEVTGILPVANGGTATSTTPANLKFLVGNGTTNEYLSLSAGSNITIAKIDGAIQITSSASGASDGNDPFKWIASGANLYSSSTYTKVGIGNISPSSTLHVTGDLYVTSSSTITGATKLLSTAAVSGALTASTTLSVTGQVSLGAEAAVTGLLSTAAGITNTGTFTQNGTSSLRSILPITDDLYANGTTTLRWRSISIGTGATTASGTLSVSGQTSLGSELQVTGTSRLAAVTATTGNFSGALKASTTLAVTGQTSLGAELQVTGASTFGASTTITNLSAGVVKSSAAGILTAGLVNLTSEVTSTLPIANGGTATSTTPANLKFLVGNGTTNEYLSIAAGTNIGSVSKLDGTLTINGSQTPTFTTITVNGTSSLAGLLLPATDNVYENGTTSLRWRSLSIGTGSLNASGTLAVTGPATFAGAVQASSTLQITGATSLGAALQVTGPTIMAGLTATTGNFSSTLKASTTLAVTGQTSLGAELQVTGLTTLAGVTATTGTFSSALKASTTLSATGQVSFGAETSHVGLASFLAGMTVTGTHTQNGTSSLAGLLLPATDNVYENGTTSLRWRSLTIGTGALNASGTLSVSGQTSLGSELQVTGVSRLAGLNATTGNFSSAVKASTTLAVTGQTSLGAELQVTGAATLGASTTITNLSAGVVKSSSAGILTAGLVNLTSEVTSALPIANGGTATSTTPANLKFLVGNGTANEYLSIAAGTNIGSISKLDGTIVVNGSLTPTFTTITVNGTSSLAGLLLPATDNLYENGTTSLRWRSLSIGTGAVNASGTLAVTGASTFAGAVQASSTLQVTGATSLGAGLQVTGSTIMAGLTATTGNFSSTLKASTTLSVTGQTSLGSELQVTGLTTLAGVTATTGTFSSAVKASTTLAVTGQVSFGAETSHVGLASFLAGMTVTGTHTQNGTTSIAGLFFPASDNVYDVGTTTLKFRSLTIGTGAINASGTLSISGQTSLGSELQVTGASRLANVSSTNLLATGNVNAGALQVVQGTTLGASTTITNLSAGLVKSSATGVLTAGQASLTSEVSGILPVGSGGTGTSTTPASLKFLVGNGTSFEYLGLSAGSNVSIAKLDGNIQITSSASGASDGNDPFKWIASGANLYASSTYTKVGIGNTTPSSTLHITGDLYVTSSSTISGAVTLNASTTITNLSAGVVKSSAAGILTAGLANLTSEVTGILPVANGGTATSTTPANLKFLVGNGTTNEYLSLSAGSNITIAKIDGAIQITSSASGASDGNDPFKWIASGANLYSSSTYTKVGIGNISPSSTLHVTGDLYVTSSSTITGATRLLSTATVSSTLSVTGQTSLGAELQVTGASALAGLTVTGTFTQNGTTSIAGLFFPASDNQYDVGTTTLKFRSLTIGTGAINASGTLSITGATSLGAALQVTGPTIMAGLTATTGKFTSGINASTTLAVTGQTSLGAELQVTGLTTLAGVTATTGTFSSALKASTTLSVTGQTSLGSELQVTGAANLLSTLKVVGAINGSSTLAITGQTSLGSELQVTGTSRLAALTATTGTFSGTMSGSTTLSVTGQTSLGAELAVTGAANFLSTLKVVSGIKASSTLEVTGATSLGAALQVTGPTILAGLTVTGTHTQNGTTSIAGLFFPASDNVYDVGTTTLKFRSLTIGTGAINASGTLSISGQTSLGSELQVTGASRLANVSSTNLLATGNVNAGALQVVQGTTLGASTTITNLSAGLVKSSATGVLTAGQASLTSEVSGILPVGSGGTGTSTTPANLKLLVGNGTTNEYLSIAAGANITVTKLDGTLTIGAGAGSGYSVVQEDGNGLTARGNLNFIGSAVTCVDNSGSSRTDCTITGGGGGVSLSPATADAFGADTDPGIFLNAAATSTASFIRLQTDGVDRFVVGANGGLTITASSTNIVKTTTGTTLTTDFSKASSTLTNVISANDMIRIDDGPAASTTYTAATEATAAIPEEGAHSIVREDGAVIIIHGNNLTTGSLWTGSSSNMTSITVAQGATNPRQGALSLRRPDGRYQLIAGASSTVSSIFDPKLVTTVAAGGTICSTAGAATGTTAFIRPDGKYVLLCGGTQQWGTIDPMSSAGTFVGGTNTPTTFGAGAMALARDDGTFLVFYGGNTNFHAIYNPFDGANGQIGIFSSSSPITSNAPIITTGSFAIRRNDGRYLIINGEAETSYIYNPVAVAGTNSGAGSMTKQTVAAGFGPASAGIEGAMAVYRQDGKYFMVAGNATTTTYIIDPSKTDSTQFIKGTALPGALGIGAHMVPRPDGTYMLIRGGAGSGTVVDKIDMSFVVGGGDPNLTGSRLATYTTECFTTTNLNIGSTLKWNTNNDGNIKFQVRTGNGGCSGGTYYDVANSGDSFATSTAVNSVQVRVLFQREFPNFLDQEWKVWRGQPQARYRRRKQDPALYDLTIDNSSMLTRNMQDFGWGGNTASTSDQSGPITLDTTVTAGGVRLASGIGVNRLASAIGSLNTAGSLGGPGFASSTFLSLSTSTSDGTMVLKRPNGSFLIILATGSSSNAMLYSPVASSSAGTWDLTGLTGSSIPTKAVGRGAFAFKRPDGKFLVFLGHSSGTPPTDPNMTTSTIVYSSSTNIYDPIANTFVDGPSLPSANGGGRGAMPIPLPDGRVLIVHGKATNETSIYDPVQNTMIQGPRTPDVVGPGSLAIPRPDGTWFFVPGQGADIGVNECVLNTTTYLFDPYGMQFIKSGAPAITTGTGPGAYAFQRKDGNWVIIKGGATTLTCAGLATSQIYYPKENALGVGAVPAAAQKGGQALQMSDGSWLIINGGNLSTTQIYKEDDGTSAAGSMVGSFTVGPTLAATVGRGSVVFQRDDGQYIVINGNGTNTTQKLDVGYVPTGMYRTEQMQIPNMDSQSTLSWLGTNGGRGISVEVRTASSSDNLQTVPTRDVPFSGALINPTVGDTWLQIHFNFKRTFPGNGGIWQDNWSELYPRYYRKIEDPTLIKFSLNKDTDLVNLKSDGNSLFRVNSSGDIYTSAGGTVNTAGADFAERYTSMEQLQPGEIVSIDAATQHGVHRSTVPYQPDLFGVVSTAPGFVAGAYTKDSYPIALVGRVPVRVNSDSGPIAVGDYITASAESGIGMKATKAGLVIGRALEPFDAEQPYATIMAFVSTQYWPGPADNHFSIIEDVKLLTLTAADASSELASFVATNISEATALVAHKITAQVAVIGDFFVKKITILPGGGINLPEGENQIAGSAILKAGQVSIEIANTQVASGSKIFITPTSPSDFPLYLVGKSSGESFTVGMTRPAVQDTTFDWLLITTYSVSAPPAESQSADTASVLEAVQPDASEPEVVTPQVPIGDASSEAPDEIAPSEAPIEVTAPPAVQEDAPPESVLDAEPATADASPEASLGIPPESTIIEEQAPTPEIEHELSP